MLRSLPLVTRQADRLTGGTVPEYEEGSRSDADVRAVAYGNPHVSCGCRKGSQAPCAMKGELRDDDRARQKKGELRDDAQGLGKNEPKVVG